MKKNRNTQVPGSWSLEHLQTSGNTGQLSTAKAKLRIGQQTVEGSGTGNGLINAAIDAISRLTETRGRITYGSFDPEFRNQPATFRIMLSVSFGRSAFAGKGTSEDIVEATALAYLDAVSQYLVDKGDKRRRESKSSI